MIGQTISHYKILEKLGEGGMGVVYKAEDTKLKRTVALKFLPPELMRDSEAKERFLHEAQAAAALEHQHICNIYEIDESEDQIFIVMSCFEGQTLKEKIDTGPLKIDEALKIAAQAAEGLQAAHEKGIVHRDIKSANIMINEKGQVKIMDFGLAKLKGQTKITKEGTTLGTASYMSPEQAQGVDVDHRTDIWALAVVLYEMIAGQLPFKGEYEPAVIYSIMNEEPEPLTAIRTGVPMELERIINKALSKDPSKRYQHADDIMVDLRALLPLSSPLKSKVTSKVKPQRKWVTITAAIIFLLLAAGVGFLLKKQTQEPVHDKTTGEIKTAQRKKIVVLPFENLGPPEDKYFADGITEEITSRLAAVSGLGVISRTSAVQYNRKGKTMTQIGEDLGVDYVLEGTVRWDRGRGEKSRVRVTPQLIRVSDDTHLWSERYDRVIQDIFLVQSEIAKHVIHHLDITLLETEMRTLNARPTKNIEAYNAYLRGIEYVRSPDYEKESWQIAVFMFKRAVELDPNFTLAYAELSIAHSGIYHMGYDRTKERISKAKAAVDRALQFQPELPEVHLALGHYYYRCHNAYQQALEEFSIARNGLPNETSILEAVAYIKRRQGRFHEAINNFKSAIELSPQNAGVTFELGLTKSLLRKYSQAELYLDRSISQTPDQIFAYIYKASNYWSWRGDLRKARDTLERMPQKNEAYSIYFWYLQEIFERNYPAALARLSSLSFDVMKLQEFFLPKSQLAGFIHQYMKKPELARTSFESARFLLEKEMKKLPDDPRIRSSLGIVYAALGRKEDAIREGNHAVELYPVSKDAVVGPHRVEDLAHIYVILGAYDTAINKLDYLLSIPYWVSVSYLQLDPKWDPLRQHPKFQRLLEKYSQDKEEKKDNK
ncbi:MAG: protein kinase [Candidatus Aminicenantes bacterium]|nr:protein kinase [Candidatus Aminicenantes bacterium]NIM82294.1 protein kinase [Candidatus Aminicenantes bacterium]NIN21677.1 protein kinase [Candidatus Aminicenantes bacterium]NIN45486.1 protein kinase [Candidatus Aminicenantes bacterium]NIN88317.1 protein kinase [Candidatus Aminicenantes bacterium]